MRSIPVYNIGDEYFESKYLEYINNQGIKYSLGILVMFLAVILWVGLYLPDTFVYQLPQISFMT